MLKALIEKLDNMQEWVGDFSKEQETVGKKSNGNTSNQKRGNRFSICFIFRFLKMKFSCYLTPYFILLPIQELRLI